MPKGFGTGLIAAAAVAAALVASYSVSLVAAGDHATLTAIHQVVQTIRRPTITAGVPDCSPAGLSVQRDTLRQLRPRLDAIDPHAWLVPQQVDYLLVRVSMAALDFDHRVVRPWSHDPALYLDAVRRTPLADVPAPADKLAAFRDNLRAVPAVLDMARRNVTEPAGELDRAHYLGDMFSLGQFHDDRLALGWIPVSLARWEMKGVDDEVKQLW